MFKLLIGNKNYSSWSLRPWLLLKQAGIEFEEILIPLYAPGSLDTILQYAPTGKVPCLIDGSLSVWESLAICEYLAESYPQLWPQDQAMRAEARSLCAEMHAGFNALRSHCPMNVRRQRPLPNLPSEVGADLARISAIFESLRARYGVNGPFLMGEFSILDAMYAPVASRCRSYQLPLPQRAQAWVDQLLALPAMQQWYAEAALEPWRIEATEAVA